MNKKIFAFALALLMCISLVACANQNSDSAESSNASAQTSAAPEQIDAEPTKEQTWTFDRRIEIMMPSPEGSGVDTTMRKFAEYLEKELGTEIVLTNMAGASGVTGFTWARDQQHDGYFFQYTSPSAIGSAVLGNFDFDFFSEVQPLARLLNTYNVIFAGKDAPFKNYEELASYATANPGKITIAIQSTTGIDGACMGKFLAACGLEMNMVNYESEATVACISGQVDLIMNTYGESEAYVKSGDLVPIILLANERNENFSEVPCVADVNLDAALENWYGFTCFEGTPQEAQDAFVAAVLKCSEIPEWREFLDNLGFNSGKACGEEEFAAVVKDTAIAMDSAFTYFANAKVN